MSASANIAFFWIGFVSFGLIVKGRSFYSTLIMYSDKMSAKNKASPALWQKKPHRYTGSRKIDDIFTIEDYCLSEFFPFQIADSTPMTVFGRRTAILLLLVSYRRFHPIVHGRIGIE